MRTTKIPVRDLRPGDVLCDFDVTCEGTAASHERRWQTRTVRRVFVHEHRQAPFNWIVLTDRGAEPAQRGDNEVSIVERGEG